MSDKYAYPLANMRIRCAHCDRQVDDVRVEEDLNRQTTVITVRCHGARDEMFLTKEQLFDPVTQASFQAILKGAQEGVAFVADELAAPAKAIAHE